MKPVLLVTESGITAGIPGEDVVRRIIMALKTTTFQECFAS